MTSSRRVTDLARLVSKYFVDLYPRLRYTLIKVSSPTCIASLVSFACSTDFSFLCEVSAGGLSVAGAGTWLSSGRAWLAPWLLPEAGRVASSSPVDWGG